MLKQLDEIQEQALAALEAVPDLAELEAWRIKHQGKKSTLNQILRDVGKLPREERPAEEANPRTGRAGGVVGKRPH
jgi:phenylalanyl-tRNA synthetase alpha chain